MQEILQVFKSYCGSGWYPVLFLAGLVYLLAVEKSRRVRIVLLYTSLVIAVLFFLPPFKRIMDILDEGTYYRILWLLPMTVVIAYAGLRLAGRHYRIGFAILTILFVLAGRYAYKSIHITKAQNRYHIPDAVIAICNEIMPGEDEERVWAVFPEELIYFVRQYSSEIQMPYGREMLETQWEWNWDTHPIYAIMREEPIDIGALIPLLEQYHVQYLILNRGIGLSGQPEENGLVKYASVEAYDVYRNPTVEIYKKQH